MISSPIKIHGKKGSKGTSDRKEEWATKYPAPVRGANRGMSSLLESQTCHQTKVSYQKQLYEPETQLSTYAATLQSDDLGSKDGSTDPGGWSLLKLS